MKKIEILSPVGEKAGFFESIKSGADALYMGLPKFNARMKAENITLEDLQDLIKYAHLKNVKVYITMNTILKNSEVAEAVAMAGECMNAGVDAFIVQDLGLISQLKSAYPHIVLHGSTQMGVHNVWGAKVAKEVGLSRVVLSRECTISDIDSIAKNVDIELEVFVQGANCVCFSGNCYLSSIKCGASGNRGECKQLCRLPYTLGDGNNNVSGYTLSPRDNCLLDNLGDLIDIGVKSLKIEGRLRNLGYIKVATSTYRQAIDSISAGEKIDVGKYKQQLKRVFARGEYVSGYNGGNNIIDVVNNNHLGIKIGKVKSIAKFKDLYKIGIMLNLNNVASNNESGQFKLAIGDGLKFKNENKIVSLGVGNVEYYNNICYVFGKNYIDIDSEVYLAKDAALENSVPDMSFRNGLHIVAHVVANEGIYVKFTSGNCICEYKGECVEKALKKPITDVVIAEQLGKVDRDIFGEPTFEIETSNAFISLSSLNAIRRKLVDDLTNKLLMVYNEKNMVAKDDFHFNCHFDINKFKNINDDYHPNNIAIVDEDCKIKGLENKFDCLMFSPKEYNKNVISNFCNEYYKYFTTPILINLPMIVRIGDMDIMEDIINFCQDKNVIFVANNIYGLYLASSYTVWAGAGLNVVNDGCGRVLKSMGFSNIIGSCEKWTSRLSGSYKISNFPLMTITSCPAKTLHGNDCAHCKFCKDLKYIGDAFSLKVRRVKIKNCYFELIDDKYNKNNVKDGSNVIDFRF